MIENSGIIQTGQIPPTKPNVQQRISIFTDGIESEYTHQSAWGFYVNVENETVHSKIGQLPNSTNDVICRFHALHEALVTLTPLDRFMDHIAIYSDNKYLTLTMKRHYAPPANPQLKLLWLECSRLAAPFRDMSFIWITKQENIVCRRMVVEYLIKGRKAASV